MTAHNLEIPQGDTTYLGDRTILRTGPGRRVSKGKPLGHGPSDSHLPGDWKNASKYRLDRKPANPSQIEYKDL